MNLGDLEEVFWRQMGQHATGQRHDWETQLLRDSLNFGISELKRYAPYWYWDIRESSFELVADTSEYTLDDFCVKVLSMWTEGDNAHPIAIIPATELDLNGGRNSNLSYLTTGPYDAVIWTRTTAAAKRGTAASVTEATSALTKTGGDDFASTDVGSRIRLNGEDMDFSVQAVGTANALTLGRTDNTDLTRAYRGRLSGIGTTGTGSGLSSVKWEITPAGTMRVQFKPAPSEAKTVYYRFVHRTAKLLNTDDVPDLEEDFHEALAFCALRRWAMVKNEWKKYHAYGREWLGAIKRMKAQDRPAHALDVRAFCESLTARLPVRRRGQNALPNDVGWGTSRRY